MLITFQKRNCLYSLLLLKELVNSCVVCQRLIINNTPSHSWCIQTIPSRYQCIPMTSERYKSYVLYSNLPNTTKQFHRLWLKFIDNSSLVYNEIIKYITVPPLCLFPLGRGRVDDLLFFEYLSPFSFLLIDFHCAFSISWKILQFFFIIFVFWLGCDRLSGLLLFVPALLLSILTPLLLPTSSVSLSYFVLAVPMRVFGKTLVYEFPMSYSHNEWYLPFSRGEIVCNLGGSFVFQNQIKLN